MDATRKSLLSAIKNPENRDAWGEFYDSYAGFVRAIASDRHLGLRGDEVEDVVSRVFIEIAAGKVRFDPATGKFRSLLTAVVRRRVIDQLRKRSPFEEKRSDRPHGDARKTGTLERIEDNRTSPDVEVADHQWQDAVLRLTVEAVKKKVKAKQFQIFDAHVLRDWDVAKVSKTLGVSANQVYLAKRRVGKVFEEEARAAAKKMDCPEIPLQLKPS